jgi:hypothetical protein
MRYADKYKHCKGGEYFFQGIAFPLRDGNLSFKTVQSLDLLGTARYHENTHDVELYGLDGVMFIDSEYPHVIYQSEKDYDTDRVWAREVDDFFGYKLQENGQLIKRFSLIK